MRKSKSWSSKTSFVNIQLIKGNSYHFMKSNGISVSERDNVAVAVQAIHKGSSVVVGGKYLFDAVEDIPLGHKVALLPLSKGVAVIRYGEPIVETTQDIPVGGWVHVHNSRPIPAGDSVKLEV